MAKLSRECFQTMPGPLKSLPYLTVDVYSNRVQRTQYGVHSTEHIVLNIDYGRGLELKDRACTCSSTARLGGARLVSVLNVDQQAPYGLPVFTSQSL